MHRKMFVDVIAKAHRAERVDTNYSERPPTSRLDPHPYPRLLQPPRPCEPCAQWLPASAALPIVHVCLARTRLQTWARRLCDPTPSFGCRAVCQGSTAGPPELAKHLQGRICPGPPRGWGGGERKSGRFGFATAKPTLKNFRSTPNRAKTKKKSSAVFTNRERGEERRNSSQLICGFLCLPLCARQPCPPSAPWEPSASARQMSLAYQPQHLHVCRRRRPASGLKMTWSSWLAQRTLRLWMIMKWPWHCKLCRVDD